VRSASGGAARTAAFSLVRIWVGAAVGVFIAGSRTMRTLLVSRRDNQVALDNCLFAQRWNNQPEEIAGIVVISTLDPLGPVLGPAPGGRMVAEQA
jgi:malate permease and related proteins